MPDPDRPAGRSPRPWIVKIGGSLASDWDLLAVWLELLARPGHVAPIVVVPGGGPFADAVRDAQDCWRLGGPVAHRMALLAMDQFGLMLHGICPALHPADRAGPLAALVAAGRPAVWLPSAMALGQPETAEQWEVTSDSLAAWLAVRLDAAALVLVKSGPCPCSGADPASLAHDGLVDAAFPAWRARFAGATWCIHRDRHAAMAAALAGRGRPGCGLPRVSPPRPAARAPA